MRSATVVGPDGTLTDALSTSVFVLGVAEGLAVIDGLEGFEAVVVDSRGAAFLSWIQSVESCRLAAEKRSQTPLTSCFNI